ncbi:MAG: response regulator [Nitrosospira sp.]
MHILIVEDDAAIAASLYDFLEGNGHSVDAAGDCISGLHLAVTETVDGILLNLGLPSLDRLPVCRKLREAMRTDDTLRTYMHELRRALRRVGKYDPFETMHGIGSRLVYHPQR